MTYIVAYDIEDNRVRSRLARYLEKCGVRLQKSVFAVKLEPYRYKAFLRAVKKITGPDGNVIVLRQCAGCLDRATQLSQFEPTCWVY